jgi:hypothetical protein
MSVLIESTPVCSLCSTPMIRYPNCDHRDAAWFCETCDVAAPPSDD